MKKINVILCLLSLCVVLNACKKDDASATYSYNVKMTDGSGPYDAVYIDLLGVEVTGTDGNAVLLNVHPGIFNLLNFSNGVDTLIAAGGLNVAAVQQIRLILGTNNSVVVNHVSYPLSTPSADQTGLKLQVHQTLQAGVAYTVLLDFDANKSIVATGSGMYKLKPVIRTIETAISGAIKGKISPVGTVAFITATSVSNITYSSNITAAGDFLLMGLPAGIYSITITPLLPLQPVMKSNVTVETNSTTNIGVIAF